MKILLTNDDGFEAAGIIALGAALKNAGHEVLTVAPEQDMSGTSHSMSITRRVAVKKHAEDFWICRGTPVDCVISVVSGGIAFKPDVVVSGVNAGANLGTDIIYSGTAAAARQAALGGFPAIAFSLVGEAPYFWEEAARWAAEHFDELLDRWTRDVFINVNMPNIPAITSGVEVGFPSRRYYIEQLAAVDSGGGWKTLNIESFEVETDFEEGSDHNLVALKKAAVSAIFLHPVTPEMLKERAE
ncbi:MAG: 5'/3'-nucleotidase SurE [Spirochaetaceae bacterium]|jgi:5'-nucleotidase|nr:5'/3'-nucleotidase SurE [Spirochaetaceae bacterium]